MAKDTSPRINKDMLCHLTEMDFIDTFCQDGDEWVTVYSNIIYADPSDEFQHSRWSWCYMVDDNHITDVLRDSENTISEGSRNGLVNGYQYKEFIYDGIEPIISRLSFNYDKLHQFRLSDEFVFYFKLFEKKTKESTKYVFFHEDDETEVVVITDNKVNIRHRFLMEYLAVKRMNLLFCVTAVIDINAKLIDFQHKYTQKAPETIRIDSDSNYTIDIHQHFETLISRFSAKHIKHYAPLETINSVFAPYVESFIYKYDPTKCKDLEIRCDDIEHKYTPIFFSLDVLEKYYLSDNTTVHPLCISAPNFHLRCDNENDDYVVVFLKDLYELPESEQKYWKSKNITPNGRKFSQHFTDSIIKGIYWGPATSVNFQIREKFEELQSVWKDKFGWKLFTDLNYSQEHTLNYIHKLPDDNMSSFTTIIGSIALNFQESINTDEIKKVIGPQTTTKEVAVKIEDKEMKATQEVDASRIEYLRLFCEKIGMKSQTLDTFLFKEQVVRSKGTLIHKQSHRLTGKDKEIFSKFNLNIERDNTAEASSKILEELNQAIDLLLIDLKSINGVDICSTGCLN